MLPRCSLPPTARTRRASRNRPRREKSSQIGISSASNIASKSFAWSAAIRRTIAVVSGFSARPKFLVDATLALSGIGGRCPWSYLTSKPPFEETEAFGGVGDAHRRPTEGGVGCSPSSACADEDPRDGADHPGNTRRCPSPAGLNLDEAGLSSGPHGRHPGP